jgi:hypothetical protein
MTAPIDAADVLEHVLRLSDAVEALVAEFGEHLPPEIEPVRAELSELERELEDVLDNREAEEALADAHVHGTISWSEFEAQLDRG